MQHDDIDEHHNFSVQSSHSHRVAKDANQINSCHIEGPQEFMVVFQTHGKEIIFFVVQSFCMKKRPS